MQAALTGFIQLLRSHDLRVSPAETLDAMAVASALGYADRGRLRDGLALSLAKSAREEAILLRCFDQYFGRELVGEKPAAADPAADPATTGQEAPASADEDARLLAEGAAEFAALAEALQTPLLQQLLADDRTELSLSLGQAGAATGLGNIRMFTQKGQYTRRMLDALGEETLRRAVVELEQAGSPLLELLKGYRDRLRDEVRGYVEQQYLLNAEGHNRQFMDDILSRTRLNQLEQRYMDEVRELVRKMARKLAARHSRKPKVHKRGQLDMGRTLRRGIAHDGVMFHTHWRKVRRDKPQILALCDVSGSVAAYAKFLLLFLYSLQDVLPRVRSFAFSSHLGEISELFRDYPVEKAIELANWRYGGATDYGRSLEDFAELALGDINSSTTVIILGDARNNGGDPKLEIMQGIYQRARRVLWLNPESRRAWGSGDSDMLRYQSACHVAAECNNLQQLERIIDQLLRQNH
ncbi:vWA domain-containing protein [Parahaliea mediterranea]|uniref:vWA domain-containing protein n=1 Tax=Parahaliea mediterranea TaxID=651086 RepID=UPI000E2E5564|nr:VWA domain-containing protein [Parahaliea mediterranea]